MGLFRKSPPKAESSEASALQAQLDALQRRIEATEVDQTHLGARVVALDDVTADLKAGQRTGGDHSAAGSTGGSTAGSTTAEAGPTTSADVDPRFAELDARFDQIVALGRQLDDLGRQLVEIQQHADERHVALRAEVDELRRGSAVDLVPRLDALDERLTATDATTADTAARLCALDERLTNVSTELANQIGELGGDIDAIANLPASTNGHHGDDGAVAQIEALSTGQAKLASEQARYEIAFREDLAALAEQIRRPSSR
jgi:hypothetical protein